MSRSCAYHCGIDATRPSIEALQKYKFKQGLSDLRLPAEDLFAPSTLRDVPLTEGQHD